MLHETPNQGPPSDPDEIEAADGVPADPAEAQKKSDIRSSPWSVVHRVSDLLFNGADASLDLCALECNRKAARYFGPDHPMEARRDGLTATLEHEDLRSWVWANIPFSAPFPWFQRAVNVSQRVPIAVLCKLAPSTKAWQRFVWPHAYDIGLFQWRLSFPKHDGTPDGTLQFDVALVRFLPRGARRVQEPRWYPLTKR